MVTHLTNGHEGKVASEGTAGEKQSGSRAKRIFKFYFCFILCVCVSVGVYGCAPQKTEEGIGPQELKFQGVVSYLMWVPRTKLRFSAMVAGALTSGPPESDSKPLDVDIWSQFCPQLAVQVDWLSSLALSVT